MFGGGVADSRLGCLAAERTAAREGLLKMLVAALIFAVAAYMIVKSWQKV